MHHLAAVELGIEFGLNVTREEIKHFQQRRKLAGSQCEACDIQKSTAEPINRTAGEILQPRKVEVTRLDFKA